MNTHLSSVEAGRRSDQKQILTLQLITLLWMAGEAGLALWAAVLARSVALLGFGADSGIELASALVVFLRFRSNSRIDENKAARVTGLLLYALAASILGASIVALTNARFQPQPSYAGMALLVAAAVVMPWLAARKRVLARRTRSASLRADATQSSVCGYMAWIALVGLGINAFFGVSWADPLAAVLLLPIIIREGREAMRGKSCSDCLE